MPRTRARPTSKTGAGRSRAVAHVPRGTSPDKPPTAPTGGNPVAETLDNYRLMCLIREFEEEAERQYKAAKIGGYCHLSSGQEATIVGSVGQMREDDLLVTGYRCHGFALARGVPAGAVMAELFGRSDGCAHGRGGSMHLLDVSRGFLGGWGIVGGQLPVATGLALALSRRERDAAVLCELGDGAVNIGAWHESLNLAALWSLPIVYLVVNNEYGMGTSVERASSETELFKRAAAFRMHGERVDGDDLEAVAQASARLLSAARADRMPAVLEAVTYRYRGHSVADAGTAYRSREEIAERRAHDPIERLGDRLTRLGTNEEQLQRAREWGRQETLDAVRFADASPEPDVAALAGSVYSPGSDLQFARMRPGSAFGEEQLVFDGGLGGALPQ